MQYTAEQLYELVTSSKSCSYFARNYVFKAPLTANQIFWLDDDERNVDLGTERQSYRTSTMLARMLWEFIFKPGTTSLYITAPGSLAVDCNRTILRWIEDLPEFMRPALRRVTKDTIESEDCMTVMRFRPATEHAGKGFSINLLAVDNLSILKPAMREEMMYSLLPCMASTAGVYMHSE
jgi:hypothetical protein